MLFKINNLLFTASKWVYLTKFSFVVFHRQMHGEELQGLTIKEVQKLEKMLEVGLRQIRLTKV